VVPLTVAAASNAIASLWPWTQDTQYYSQCCTAYLLYEVTYHRVVEELNGCPLNAFTNIFLLLLFESCFHHHLMELLIAKIDDKLLKPIPFKHLEPIHIQDAQHSSFTIVFHLQQQKLILYKAIQLNTAKKFLCNCLNKFSDILLAFFLNYIN